MEQNQEPFVAICLSCGFPLKQMEISAQITGQTIDYEKRIAIQNTNYQLCTECAERTRTYLTGGIKKAQERRNSLQEEIRTLDLSSTGTDKAGLIIGS